jgi:hypothetical protein
MSSRCCADRAFLPQIAQTAPNGGTDFNNLGERNARIVLPLKKNWQKRLFQNPAGFTTGSVIKCLFRSILRAGLFFCIGCTWALCWKGGTADFRVRAVCFGVLRKEGRSVRISRTGLDCAARPRADPMRRFGLGPCVPPEFLPRKPPKYALSAENHPNNHSDTPPSAPVATENGRNYGYGAMLRTHLSCGQFWPEF